MDCRIGASHVIGRENLPVYGYTVVILIVEPTHERAADHHDIL